MLRHAGGLRVDHVIGLFRLWWVPGGQPAGEGTYVRYDHEALIGILALEAHRAGAVVVGEDLGVVRAVGAGLPARARHPRHLDPVVRASSTPTAGRCGRSGGGSCCLASVTTHDLPPTAGYLAGEHVRLRDSLGLLTRPLEEELAARRGRARRLARGAALRGWALRRGRRRGARPWPRCTAT